MVAGRAPHEGEQLGTQVTFLAAGAYTFENDMALALSASYAFEGDASASNGADVPMSSRRLTVVNLSGLWPVSYGWRILGGVFLEPPVDGLGSNQPASGGLTLDGDPPVVLTKRAFAIALVGARRPAVRGRRSPSARGAP